METLNHSKDSLKEADAVFVRLYKEVFPTVARYIAKRGGTLDKAKDVFQDALIIYYEQHICNGSVVKQTEMAYLFGIVKHLWINHLKLDVNYEPISNDQMAAVEKPYEEIAEVRLTSLLMKAGDRCMQLLKSFYYDKLSMRLMAERFGFTSERSATVQKFKCLEKMRGYIKDKILQYEDFIK